MTTTELLTKLHEKGMRKADDQPLTYLHSDIDGIQLSAAIAMGKLCAEVALGDMNDMKQEDAGRIAAKNDILSLVSELDKGAK